MILNPKSVTLKIVTQQILHAIHIIIWIEIYKIFYQWELKIIDFQFLGRDFYQLEHGQVWTCTGIHGQVLVSFSAFNKIKVESIGLLLLITTS